MITNDARLEDGAMRSRAETYVHEKPCNHGHAPIRYTKSKQCCECINIRNARRRAEMRNEDNKKRRERYAENPEPAKSQRREYYRKNAETCRQKRREYVDRNYEAVRESKKEYYKNNRARILEKDKQYHADNRGRRNAYSREYLRRTGYCAKYHEKNRDRRNRYSREYGKKNPEINRSKNAKRRSFLKSGVSGPELRDWVSKQEKVCYWCSKKCAINFHLDHYTPLSKGGPHQVNNLVIACSACNLKKNAKDPYEFANQIGRLF